MLTHIIQAMGLFVVTNIDDVIILSLFFARGAGKSRTTACIMLGQMVGFVGILAVAILTAWGANTFLPPQAIPYFGLIPLVLGLKAAWDAFRGEDDDELDSSRGVSIATVATVTFANGGDNIGVYVPVFLSVGYQGVLVYSLLFLLMTVALVYLAKFVATRPGIDELLEKGERFLFPLVLIVLGIAILVSGGAFGL